MEPEASMQADAMDEQIPHAHLPKWDYEASPPYEGAVTVCESYPECQFQFQYLHGPEEGDPMLWCLVAPEDREPPVFTRAEFMESLEGIMANIADVIDMAEYHESQMGLDNPGAVGLTRLREAGVWFLAQQAVTGGTSIQDALRQI